MKINFNEINIWNVPLGKKNKLLLLIHKYKFLSPLKFIISRILHLELPTNSYELSIRLPHPYNVIINKRSKLSRNLTIYQNVTIGSKQFGNKKGVPDIKENVIIYPNCVLVGDITVGKNSIIGAGSIVTNDVEEYSIVAGNPAKIVGKIEKKDLNEK